MSRTMPTECEHGQIVDCHKRQTARISRLEDGIREALDRLRLSPGVAEIAARLRELLEDK